MGDNRIFGDSFRSLFEGAVRDLKASSLRTSSGLGPVRQKLAENAKLLGCNRGLNWVEGRN
jgi:hypothetical protein